jgi:tetratricopeptide (TPR) repeat protein
VRPVCSVISLVLLADDLAAQEPLKKLERGLTAARQGNCAAAIPDLQAAVNENERLVPALNALAVCEAAMGDSDRASAGFERITKLEPNAWQAWNNLASYLSSNRPERALEALRKAVKLSPGAANAWFHLGSAFNALGRTVDAFGALDHAQRMSSSDLAITKAWLDTAAAIATEASGRIEKREFSQARTLSRPLGNSASWNNLLGYAEFKLGHPEPALQRLQKALALDPNNEDYLLDIGEFLGYHRAPKNAVELFEAASRRMSNSPRVQFGLAVSYILVGRRDDAVKLLESLIASDRNFEPAYRALGECYEDAGNWDGLIKLGIELQAVNPSNPGGWYLEGAGRLKNAAVDNAPDAQALTTLRRAASLDPASSRIHFTLAKAYQQSDQNEMAIQEFKETLRLDQQHERAHYVLARLYQKLGERELAKKEMEAHSRIKEADRAAQYRALIITSRNP